MKIAVVGSRGYPRLELVTEFVKSLPSHVTVVSGGARGVDTTAEVAAKRAGLAFQVFAADWKDNGKMAGLIRNREIVAASDWVVAFHDGRSPGTRNTIQLARTSKKPLTVYDCEGTATEQRFGIPIQEFFDSAEIVEKNRDALLAIARDLEATTIGGPFAGRIRALLKITDGASST